MNSVLSFLELPSNGFEEGEDHEAGSDDEVDSEEEDGDL